MNMDQTIARIESLAAYTFHNKLLCAEALQMGDKTIPLTINGTRHIIDKNERLECLGDAWADATLCNMWYASRDTQGSHPLPRKSQRHH
jgi:dsRNA-specific ribonuclease